MIWSFINTGFNTGKYNMNYDLQLAADCKPNEAILRLYRWAPYCISIGANQSFESIDKKKEACIFESGSVISRCIA